MQLDEWILNLHKIVQKLSLTTTTALCLLGDIVDSAIHRERAFRDREDFLDHDHDWPIRLSPLRNRTPSWNASFVPVQRNTDDERLQGKEPEQEVTSSHQQEVGLPMMPTVFRMKMTETIFISTRDMVHIRVRRDVPAPSCSWTRLMKKNSIRNDAGAEIQTDRHRLSLFLFIRLLLTSAGNFVK